jgi:hypothetical protein
MAAPARERAGVLVLRAWEDSFSADGFRVRVMSRLDLESSEDDVHAAASIEDVLEIVRDWLRAFCDE